MWDVAIIGGGTAGLAAAALAAFGEKSVVLLEKGKVLGGRATSSAEGGALLNLGPHALYRNGPAQRVLDRLGFKPTGGAPGPNLLWVSSQGEIVTSAGLLLGRKLNWSEKRQVIKMMLGVRKQNPEQLAGTSWDRHLSVMGLTGRAKEVFEALGRLVTYVGDVTQLDAGMVISQLQKPIIYPDGGWQTIVNGMVRQAESVGVKLLPGAGVTRAHSVDGGGWSLDYDKGSVTARQVIAAVAPAQLAALFGELLPAGFVQKLRVLEPVMGACLDLHLKSLPSPERTFALGTDEPLYLSVHSRWAKLTEQSGHAVVHVMRYGGAEKPDAARTRLSLEGFLDRLQPGWRQVVVRQRYLPSLTVSHARPAPELRGALDRPGVNTGVPGLYAAGDWVGEEGLLFDASMASAEVAARLVLQNAGQRG